MRWTLHHKRKTRWSWGSRKAQSGGGLRGQVQSWAGVMLLSVDSEGAEELPTEVFRIMNTLSSEAKETSSCSLSSPRCLAYLLPCHG